MATADVVTLVTLLRPPIVTPGDKTGWYRAIGNTEVVDWLKHATSLDGQTERSIKVVVVPSGSYDASLLDTVEHDLIPLVFDYLSVRAGRRAKRNLKAASAWLSLPKRARPNQRLKPLFHK